LEVSSLDSSETSKGLLESGDVSPVGAANLGARSPFLLIGDHAGRAIPRRLGGLGLARGDLDRHIACDIGVLQTGLHLAAALNACFIHQTYSRLVIDCNRTPGSPDSIPAISDRTVIPGNADLTAAQCKARLEEIYQPYHDRIGRELDERQAAGAPTVLVALHSFTPLLQGVWRPWRFGVLHRGDSPFSARMLAVMRSAMGDAVGDNEPYEMDETDNTVPLQRRSRPIDYLELEVRQDLIGDEAGQRATSRRLSALLGRALGAP
jgi:predicted N-formylglutamate amidohydrolase